MMTTVPSLTVTEVYAEEVNSSMDTAKTISYDTTYDDEITESVSERYYKITVPTNGTISLKHINTSSTRVNYDVFTENGSNVFHDEGISDTTTFKIGLSAGTYYIAVSSCYSSTGTYQLKTTFKTADETCKTDNGSMDKAYSLSMNTTINGLVSADRTSDFYKITVPSNGTVYLSHINTTSNRFNYDVYASNGSNIFHDEWITDSTTFNIGLSAGTYYIAVSSCYSSTGAYQLKATFKTANETCTTDNGSMDDAYAISLDQTINGLVSADRTSDFYKVTVPASGILRVSHINTTDNVFDYNVYAENGSCLLSKEWISKSRSYDIEVEAGTYYIAVFSCYGSTGAYQLNTSFLFTSSMPSLAVSNSGSSELKLSWDKINGATGYEIYRSTSENGTYTKIATTTSTSYSDKSLTSGKTYYYKVRAYKTVNNTKAYSDYSTIVSKKVLTAMSATTISLSNTSMTYTGSALKPTVTVKNGSTTLKNGTDYTVSYSNNTKVGTATVTITGKGNYTGTVNKTFKINAKSISKFTATLSTSTYTYDGKVKKPSVTLKNGSTTISSSNYTVTYASGRKNVGTYKVTIKGKGNYTGTITKTFKINPAKTTLKSLTKAKKAITVKWTKKTTQVTGYQIQYSTSSKFSSAKTVTISSNKTISKKITGLKSNTKYYVRIRTYKTVNGTKYYSGWSSSKNIKTK
ncbi:MAG: fibronectin type III domain-containing protein [Erysipelotrichaceae bacterium]|nr:fibronectin type III domain-containing protein [Erysipelotrichaceae bacterium]